MRIGEVEIGPGHPCYVVGEIGINHNGSVETACELVNVAADAGCNAVKFQKRTPEVCVPRDQWDVQRDTPWGVMSYIEYKRRIELSADDFERIDHQCKARGIAWFASPWDLPSVDFLERFDPPAYKLASASLTDRELRHRLVMTGRPLVMSTGMTSAVELSSAMLDLADAMGRVLWCHAVSAYPCPPEATNLRMLQTLRGFVSPDPVGYSGHETGLQITLAAVAMGASLVERHITLDRTMWGTDHAASLEPDGLRRLVRDIRIIEAAMGDGIKGVHALELPARAKLRGDDR